MEKSVALADYHNPHHASAIAELMDCYAQDQMGGGQALDVSLRSRIAPELAKRSYAYSVLAFVNGQAAGLINCFEAFSTFRCQALVNIHDVIVAARYRKMGIAKAMFALVEDEAANRQCCKLTLEVLSANEAAKNLYTRLGFSDYQLDPEMGTALFWQKELVT